MRVATGEQVHPTVTSFLEHYRGPPVAVVPFSDLPPSEAVLVWRTADRSAKIQAFVRAAADVLADELAAHQPRSPTR
jgi:DNA-binding transcriptional LysR family regulator